MKWSCWADVQVAGLPTNAEFMRRITLNAEFQQVRAWPPNPLPELLLLLLLWPAGWLAVPAPFWQHSLRCTPAMRRCRAAWTHRS